MAENSLQRSHVRPALRIVLVSGLIICGGMVLVSIVWIYHKIHYSLGLEIAEVSTALMSILILGLMSVGIRTGLGVDRFIRRRRLETCRFYRSSSHVRQFLALLGYTEIQLSCVQSASEDEQKPDEMLAIIDKPRRRGRLPTHSLDRWTKVVLAWENRDSLRNPMTLTEFLCEQFGEYADGSPRMSENSFYENRKKVIEELRKESATK